MNTFLLNEVKQRIGKVLKENYDYSLPINEIILQETKKEFRGDITYVVFPITRYSKKNPEQTAQEIGETLAKEELFSDFEVIKGFLNLTIRDSYFLKELNKALEISNISMDTPESDKPKIEKVMVEFSSPNTNKPLHLGHVRNNLLGNALAEILKANGYPVIKTCLVNDRGIHICKSMVAYEEWGKGETPESTKIKGDHFVGRYYVLFEQELKKEIAQPLSTGMEEEVARNSAPLMLKAKQMLLDWENRQPDVIALWKKMNQWVYSGFEETYQRLGINFDRFYYESDTYLLGKDLIEEGLRNGVFYKKLDESVWIDLTQEGLDHKLVLRSDGTSVYITQDLGTAQLKFADYAMQRSIHVVGNEQDYHFKVLFLILKKLGKDWSKGLFHLSYGMVDLPTGKMKSREGTVVDADDLMDQMLNAAALKTSQLGKTMEMSETEKAELYRKLGLGALKYFLLRIDPQKRILFDPEESIDLQGNTATFIQYSYARICSILRKSPSKELGQKLFEVENFKKDVDNPLKSEFRTQIELNQHLKFESSTKDSVPFNSDEKILLKHLLQFEIALEEAANLYSPAHLCNYLYELSKKINHFYHNYPILKESDFQILNFRIALCEFMRIVIYKGMSILGIELPEKM